MLGTATALVFAHVLAYVSALALVQALELASASGFAWALAERRASWVLTLSAWLLGGLGPADDARWRTALNIQLVRAVFVVEDTSAIQLEVGEWPRARGSCCRARRRRATPAATQAHPFELVCWEAAQTPIVRSRETGLAAAAKMPAVEPATAEPGAGAAVAPWCSALDYRQCNRVIVPAEAKPEKRDGEQTKAGASAGSCGDRASQQAAKPVTVTVPRPIRRAKRARVSVGCMRCLPVCERQASPDDATSDVSEMEKRFVSSF